MLTFAPFFIAFPIFFSLYPYSNSMHTSDLCLLFSTCETDFSGYPDCRDDTIKALQVALNLGMESRFVLETPLMWIDKSQTWSLAARLGGTALVDLIRDRTVTCYQGDIVTSHEWGRGCGVCPACALRARGFQAFKGTPASARATELRM